MPLLSLFLLGGMCTILCFLNPPSRRSNGSFTSSHLHAGGVGGAGVVDVEGSDSSSVLSFYLSSFLALSFPKHSHYEVLESITSSLLILVCDVFCEQYETVQGIHV